MRLCVCGHEKERHRHHRAGLDCGTCGRDLCPKFHSATVLRSPVPRSLRRGVKRMIASLFAVSAMLAGCAQEPATSIPTTPEGRSLDFAQLGDLLTGNTAPTWQPRNLEELMTGGPS